ncbi:MAG: hypothetical protein ACRCTI_05410, partial [Beijerinckiaceae bacterium]
MSETFTLSYRDSAMSITVHDGADIRGALEFLSSHFVRIDGPNPGATTIDVLPLGDADPTVAVKGEPIFVRRSASDFFTIPARRVRSTGRERVVCDKTGTVFDFLNSEARVTVHVGPEGQLDVIELIRDIVLKEQEIRGAMVVHGTAAVRDGGAVLIAGSKGAGKSTVLLELVEHFGYQILSGDKTLVVRADGATVVAGWPDY